jgi:TRAP-type mannitol/chloroaromatic compound transport system substrate-binding protein
MQSAFPASFPVIADAARDFSETLDRLSDGKFKVSVLDAGVIVPSFQTLEAVQQGIVDFGWAPLAYFSGKDPALELLSSVPFTFDGDGHRRWRNTEAVKYEVNALMASHGVVSIPCAGISRNGEFWLRKQINSAEDLKGLKIRAGGQTGKIYQGLGIVPTLLPIGEIFPALERGVIDGATSGTAALSLLLGLNTVTPYYYYPSVTNPALTVDLIVNKTKYEVLPRAAQDLLWTVCAGNHDRTITKAAEYEAKALQSLRGAGAVIAPLSDPVERVLRASWKNAREQYETASVNYKKIMDLVDNDSTSSRISSGR